MKKIKIILPIIFLVLGFLGVWLLLRCTPYPEMEKLQQQKYSCRIYDKNHQLIQITTLEDGLRQEFTPLEEIPKDVIKIFLTAEDQRFYYHHGVDWLAALAAVFQNYSSKRTVRGASTITMQLAKICSPVTEKTFSRKIQDVINAFKIEARLTKKEILQLYLNSVPFGMNVSGVTSAARSFYGKELQELTTEEICCLSVIPRRPASYNPIENPMLCAEMAKIIARKTQKAKPDKIEEAAKSAIRYKYPYNLPHYIFYLKKTEPSLFDTYERFLSIDMEIQKKAENLILEALENSEKSRISNGALLLIDNTNGEVISWVGNGNWFDNAHSGQIDGILVKNQPGSSMKPFLYALAFDTLDENGNPLYYPSKVIPDIPKEFGNEKLYIPANFNNQFNGPVRTRIALASSLNIPAVTILQDIGIDNYLDKLYQLGFDSLHQGGKAADLGLSLGAGEVTLQELVYGFSVFPRDGKNFQNEQIYSQDTARLICSILSDKAARALGFGYAQTFQTEYPSIFKTGTSNQYQNITALGATKKYTIGVWMGNFEGQTVIGKTGSSLPAAIAKKILDMAEEKSKNDKTVDSNFEEPENWELKKICSLSGLLTTSACPAAVYEYVKEDLELETCNWHQKNQKEIIFPTEYQQWLRKNKINGTINYSSGPLNLSTPKDNSVFYYSNTKATNQAIPVELNGGTSDFLQIYYDNNPAITISRPFIYRLPLEKGIHSCKFLCDQEEINITFTVK